MPRKKYKPLPPILKNPVSRPDYYQDDEWLWNFLNKDNFIDQEKALFEYMGIPYEKITQKNVKKLIHALALMRGMRGFSYIPFKNDNSLSGKKGLVLYLRMQKEQKETGDNLRNCASKLAELYKDEYTSNEESLYSEYTRILKNNKQIHGIKNLSLDKINELLYWLNIQ